MRYCSVVSLLLVIGLAACQPSSTPTQPKEGDTPAKTEKPKPEINVGDVEYALNIAAALAPESQAGTIASDVLVDALKRPNLLTLTVSPPAPKEIWILYNILSRSSFATTPVVLRVKFVAEFEGADGKMEEKELGTHNLVITDLAPDKGAEYKVEVMGKLGTVPKSVLVRTRCQALLMPKGTDSSTLNPETAAVDEEWMTEAITSCPVRINFE